MSGVIYGVGTGPGDPEFMTLKAVRVIRESEIIAFAGKSAEESVAYRIAAAAIPEISEKELVPVYMPMIKDRRLMAAEHMKGAKLLERYLEQGKNVVYLTLGDPTIYCTFSYLHHILEEDGFQVELVNGITSFCAAAARLNVPLAEWDELLHIIPAVHKADRCFMDEGNYVIMKSAGHMKEIKEILKEKNLEVQAVENCGMDTEKVYRNLREIPDDAGYFTLLIAKQ